MIKHRLARRRYITRMSQIMCNIACTAVRPKLFIPYYCNLIKMCRYFREQSGSRNLPEWWRGVAYKQLLELANEKAAAHPAHAQAFTWVCTTQTQRTGLTSCY